MVYLETLELGDAFMLEMKDVIQLWSTRIPVISLCDSLTQMMTEVKHRHYCILLTTLSLCTTFSGTQESAPSLLAIPAFVDQSMSDMQRVLPPQAMQTDICSQFDRDADVQ